MKGRPSPASLSQALPVDCQLMAEASFFEAKKEDKVLIIRCRSALDGGPH
jgi:hypothetical protein